jgi:uncharacterized protein (TIRG00374 family)
VEQDNADMKRGKIGAFFTVLGLVLFIAYLVYTNPFKVLTEVGRFDLTTFLVAVGVNYVGLVLLAASWHILLIILGISIPLYRSVQITFVSMFAVWVFPFPSGVEIIRAYLVRNEIGSNHGKAVSSSIVCKVYYFISFGFLISIAAFKVLVMDGGALPVAPSYVYFVVLFALMNTLIFGVIMKPSLLRRLYDISPTWLKTSVFDRVNTSGLDFYAFIDEMDISVALLSKKPVENLLSLVMVAFHWSTGSITAYLVAASLGFEVSFWVIVLIYAVIEFIQQLNILIPSGLGVVDAGLTGAFVLVGAPLGTASAISLLTRLATYWFELILCGLVSFQFGYREALRDYLE